MAKLWQKDWNLHAFTETFETKDDILLDQKLVHADVFGSLAHAQGLLDANILTEKEYVRLHHALMEIIARDKKNKFLIQPGDEDIHSKIENFLTERCGDVGKKIHTGRSRNDQVLTAVRLYTRDELLIIWHEAILLCQSYVTFAKRYKHVPMPGYTHTQRAMPYSVGAWTLSFVSGILESVGILEAAYMQVNQSPLGSAASFGVPLPLNKEKNAARLGFSRARINSLANQSSRGKGEAITVAACIALLQDVNKFATDIILFTSSEFPFFYVDKTICTGSSIMPQKKNVDIAELIRAKVHSVLGNYTALVSMSTNLISGYHRDLQDMKRPLFDSLEKTKDSLVATRVLLDHITPNLEQMARALSPEIFATHEALKLVAKGVPFRDAYKQVGEHLDEIQVGKLQEYITQSANSGDTGNLQIPLFVHDIKSATQRLRNEQKKVEKAKQKIFDTIDL